MCVFCFASFLLMWLFTGNSRIRCKDGSDEPVQLCNSERVPNLFQTLYTQARSRSSFYCPFQCGNGRCRSTAIVCSGRDGCGDNSDEQRCAVCRKYFIKVNLLTASNLFNELNSFRLSDSG